MDEDLGLKKLKKKKLYVQIDGHTFLKIHHLEWVSFVFCGELLNLKMFFVSSSVIDFLKMFFSSITETQALWIGFVSADDSMTNLLTPCHDSSRSSYISPVCLRIRSHMWTVRERSLGSSSSSTNSHRTIMRWEYFVCMCVNASIIKFTPAGPLIYATRLQKRFTLHFV